MLARALVTQKNANVGAAPLWVLAFAIETNLRTLRFTVGDLTLFSDKLRSLLII
jgi:hypothetical protein